MNTCMICGQELPDVQLFDLKGNVEGGRKATCAPCGFKLYGRALTALGEIKTVKPNPNCQPCTLMHMLATDAMP